MRAQEGVSSATPGVKWGKGAPRRKRGLRIDLRGFCDREPSAMKGERSPERRTGSESRGPHAEAAVAERKELPG